MQRARQMDSLQGFVNSFKQFEKKLDKLQEDVSYYGNSLGELRSMVSNLASTLNDKDDRKMLRKTVGVQYEVEAKTRRVDAIRPLPSKLKTKSLLDQKYRMQVSSEPFPAPKKISPPAVNKHHRLRKEAPRKSAILRPQKIAEKKRSKLRK